MARIFFVVLLMLSMFLTACSNGEFLQKKFAVIDMEQVADRHPLAAKLKEEELVLQDLVQKRKNQELAARSQLESLDKLRELKSVSEKTYLSADYNTRMFAAQARENVRLQKLQVQAEQEAESVIAERKKEIEDAYQLKMFNLRVRLDSVKIGPDERASLEEELAVVRNSREEKLRLLDAEKSAYVEQKMTPFRQESKERLSEQADQLQLQVQKQLQQSEAKYNDMFKDASPALKNMFAIMDREIKKQQDKNSKIKQQIDQDIEKIVADLAAKNNYEIVFREVKVNVNAEDITSQVISALPEKQSK